MKNTDDLFREKIGSVAASTNLDSKEFDSLSSLKRKIGEVSESGLSSGMSLQDIAKKHCKKNEDIKKVLSDLKKELEKGIKVEKEHTKNVNKAKKIAMDHLTEDPKYYSKLKKIETKEATGTGSSGQYSQPLFSGEEPKKPVTKENHEKIEATEATSTASSGSYETPSAWAKSTKKKDWRGKSKTQIPGGAFVSVKSKCKKFPYCNQGDIKALNIYKNESLKEAIKSFSNKSGLSEITIKAILEYELENINKQ